MSDLTELLNKGRGQVPITRMVAPFDVKMGPIPTVVPVLRDDGREFAGGNVVLAERLNALRSGNAQQIEAWGNNYYGLADACITFEDLLKAQPDSPLLKGIRGIVETSDGLYVAIDEEAVYQATKGNMRHFQVRGSETVTYGVGDNKVSKQAGNVVLFKYAKPSCVELTGDQFNVVDAQSLKRVDFTHGRGMEETEVVEGKEVIHPVYKALWPAELVVPLVSETFKFNVREYAYDTNMGVYLAGEPQNHAEMRVFCANGLDCRSGLCGTNLLGSGGGRLVGVVEKSAAGAAKK